MKTLLPLLLIVASAALAQEPADDHPLATNPVQLGQDETGGNPPVATAPGQEPATPATATPAPPSEADAIPQAYRADRYQSTLAKNPFLIKVIVGPPPTASFAEDWDLKYLSERNGVTKAGIQNRKTQEFRNITTEPDGEGFRLVKATISRNRKESEAEIAKGAETATFKYSDTPAPAAAQRPGVVPGQPGAAVQRGAVPGRPPVAMPPGAAGGIQQRGAGAVPSPNAVPNAINRRRVLVPPPSAPAP